MLPIWTGLGDQSNQGLCTGTENYWCVNRNADPADIDATLDFLLWCVTSETGTEAMAEKMGFAIPFDTAAQGNNPFLHRSQESEQAGKTKLPWSFVTIPSEAWKTGLVEALKDYAAGPTEENWAAVERSFIDGWAAEAASEEEVAQ